VGLLSVTLTSRTADKMNYGGLTKPIHENSTIPVEINECTKNLSQFKNVYVLQILSYFTAVKLPIVTKIPFLFQGEHW
jgi:hypothetical protein